jgi:hypothetical protein
VQIVDPVDASDPTQMTPCFLAVKCIKLAMSENVLRNDRSIRLKFAYNSADAPKARAADGCRYLQNRN